MITFILALLLVSFATSIDTTRAESAYDGLRIFYAENVTDIQVDEMDTDRIYVSAGSYLYGLNGNLELEEIRSLTSQSVNISLSSDGRRLVVCMTDLSCEVYNAANLSNGSITRRPNAIISAKNMALFAADDRFYVGSISPGAQRQIFLNWYAYSGNQWGSGTYDINRDGFERSFYGGFVKGSNAYYFATDNINKPLIGDDRLRNFKVMRVCNNSSSSIGALYELSLGCDSLRPGADTRISGISVVEDFAGIPGTTIILSRSRPESAQNFVCLYSLQMIDTMMQRKFDSCSSSQLGSTETIKLAWRNPSIHCSTAFQLNTSNNCHFKFTVTFPLALDNFETLLYNERKIVDLCSNFITASVAFTVESVSFIILAYTKINGSSFIIGLQLNASDPMVLYESDGFDKRLISNEPVKKLQWQHETEIIYAITNNSVIQFPLVNCSSRSDCASCIGNSNPLCGWCVVENKCSRRSSCRNSWDSAHWIQAARPMEHCLTIMVSPEQYVVDDPQTVTLNVSQSLPRLLDNETYLCQFTSKKFNLVFSVVAVSSGTSLVCNITDAIPVMGLATVFDVSVVSFLQGIPFSTQARALTVYQCNATQSCSKCLQTNNACGWCVYSKVCSGTPAPFINGSEDYLQLQLGMNQSHIDTCPLLGHPHTAIHYLEPLHLSRNIELVARNLPPENSRYHYVCRIGDIDLPALYNNETSLACLIDTNLLTFYKGFSMSTVNITIHWVGQTFEGQNINHPIDVIAPVTVTLYSCTKLTDGCSSCLGFRVAEGFECGWCDRAPEMADSCTYDWDCEAALITEGSGCPPPVIVDFNPKSGPFEGGTTISITGRDLGVTFYDFNSSSIRVETIPCIPIQEGYASGREIQCQTTERKLSIGALSVNIEISLSTGQAVSEQLFRLLIPEITEIDPILGPVAGGTQLTLKGQNLNIGNIYDTRITVSERECDIDQTSIRMDSINCTTQAFTNASNNTPVTGPVIVFIDNAIVSNSMVNFTYTLNPEYQNITPTSTIPAGGVEITFTGTNLDVVQNPVMAVNDCDYVDVFNISSCRVHNSSTMSCVTPPLTRIPRQDRDGLNYTIVMDNAPGPDLTLERLQIKVLPNPENFTLITTSTHESNINGALSPIQITGDSLASVSSREINITVEGEDCVISTIEASKGLITCIPPAKPPNDRRAAVHVLIGKYLKYTLEETLLYEMQDSYVDTLAIVSGVTTASLVIAIVIVILIVIVIFHIFKQKQNKMIYNLNSCTHSESYHHLFTLSQLSQEISSHFSYEQLLKQVPKKLIIPNRHLHTLRKIIGQGEFGIVFKAHLVDWFDNQKQLTVAVKALKCVSTASDVEKMLAEIAKMENLSHPNVMPLIGVCIDEEHGMSIVMPFMANGSLLGYLKREREHLYLGKKAKEDVVLSVSKLLLRICHQIAMGMEYLVLQKFVHRDLAARNCMLDSHGNVRVGDFGLAEDVYTRGYYRQGKTDTVKLPFKWMAPESLRDGLFSVKSDVWSFGVTCWEIFSGGRIPYPTVSPLDILKYHEEGMRLEKPSNAACTADNYAIMKKCWALNPKDRPTFKELRCIIERILQKAAGYLELNMVLSVSPDSTLNSGYEIVETPFKDDLHPSELPLICHAQSHRTHPKTRRLAKTV